MFLRIKPDPHTCYIASFGIAMIVYTLGWSELYPQLQLSLMLFLFATIIVHAFLSLRQQRRKVYDFNMPDPSHRWPVYVTAFIYFLWLLEFIYEGGIPLLKILLDIPYDYRLFGIPSLHVFVVTFSSFYTVYLFQLYLARRSRLVLLLFVINLAAAVLIYSRAMLFFNMSASLILYLNYKGGFTIRQFAATSVSIIALFYVFGLLGSLRVSRIAGQPYNNENFMETGQASGSFRESFVPNEYFWAYIYISSPLANLQQNIRLHKTELLTAGKVAQLVNEEIFPDFISKRVIRLFGLRPPVDSRIPGPFNVSTIYSRSHSYAGWAGIGIMAIFLIVFPAVFAKILPASSRFFLSAWSILCVMYFFSVYDNTFRFTGLSLQLAYPLLLHWLDQKFSRLQQVF